MKDSDKITVQFDYISFLGESCNKRWSFLEALGPFDMIEHDDVDEAASPGQSAEQRLWERALHRMSPRRSDESNLITLIKLARTEGIHELKLSMPYGLELDQIHLIENKTRSRFHRLHGDEFVVECCFEAAPNIPKLAID